MEGTIALIIPIVAVGGFFAWMIALSPVGKAYAEKIRGRAHEPAPLQGQEEILETLDDLRRQVAELAERVDFTERILAKRPEATQLPRGGRVPE
ncbi:MAG TPA: hypothetical protein VMH88_09000 [Gemmatimonadales bacterium]|nr:hypothetical protein [Gemmatimonadales bacterium]